MKIKPTHLDHLRSRIQPLDTPTLRANYVAQALSDKRYRWDLLDRAVPASWVCTELYPYLNDTHIDTALRSLVPPLIQPLTQPQP